MVLDPQSFYTQLWILSGKINIAVMFLPILSAMLFFSKLNKPLRVLFYFCLVTLALNVFEQGIIYFATKYYTKIFKPYMDYWEIEDTTFLFILYVLKDFIFLGWFYYLLFSNPFNAILRGVTIFLGIAAVVNYLFIEGYNVYGYFNPIVSSLYYLIIPGFYIWLLYKNFLHFPLNKNPYFWISFGLGLPSLAALIYFWAGHNIANENYILFAKIAIIKNGIDFISQIIIAIGFWYASFARFIVLPEKKRETPNIGDSISY